MKALRIPVALVLLIGMLASCAPVHERVGHGGGPLTFEERLRLANIYESRGRLTEALREYRKASELNPNDARPYFGMGNVYLGTRDYANAEASYLRAIELDPTKGAFFNNLGWVYIETGRLIIAQAMVMRGLTLDPRRQYIYLDTLGVIETRLGNYKEAERYFKRALAAIAPTDLYGLQKIYANLHDLYRITGRTDEAEKTMKTIKGLERGIPPAIR